MNRTVSDQLLQDLEGTMQQLVYPFLSNSALLETTPPGRNLWSFADHLEYVFHVNQQLVMNLHTLPSQEKKPKRNPTLSGYLLLWFGYYSASIDEQMARYQPGRHDTKRDRNWLSGNYEFWNDKLAGLYFLPEGWQQKVLDKEHPKLGRLTGSDWMRVMTRHTKYHLGKVEQQLDYVQSHEA